MSAGALPRIGFIFSTEVGLKTQYLNWRHGLEKTGAAILPEWITIEWTHPGGWIERLPGVPGGVKARLRSQLELSQGLRRGPFDALFIGAPTVVYGRKNELARQPYFITIDTTPTQLYAFGDLYGKGPSRFARYEAAKERRRRELYRGARALFPWSHWAAQSMIDDYGAAPERVHVAPPGVDLAKWHMPERASGPAGDTRHLLFVGGDFHRKGGDLLLEWAKRTARRDWELHLVTRDPVPGDDPRIHVYHGLSPNDPALIELYRKADLFVLPTRGDCYSLAGIEAMAAGLPVLLSRTGGTGDILRDGETGYLLEPGDADGLHDRLEHLLDRPELCRQMGRAARLDAEARYDVHQNIRRVVCQVREYLEA